MELLEENSNQNSPIAEYAIYLLPNHSKIHQYQFDKIAMQ